MKGKWSYFGLYAAFLLVGLLWLNEIDTRGHYADSKQGFAFYGNEWRVPTYLIMVVSVMGMIHSIIMNWGPHIKMVGIGTVSSIGIAALGAVATLKHDPLPLVHNPLFFFFWVLVLLGSPIFLLLALTTIYTIFRVQLASSKAPLLIGTNALGLVSSMYFMYLMWAFVWGPH